MSDFSEGLKSMVGSLGLNPMLDAPPPQEGSGLAAHFMQALKDSRRSGDAAGIQQELDKAVKAAGVSGDLDAEKLGKVADKLITSFDALVRNEYAKNPDGSVAVDSEGNKQIVERGLDPGVKSKLRDVIVNSGAKNTAELAATLKDFKNSDSDQKEDLFLFLHRGGKDFSVVYEGDEIQMVRQFLNMITPGLGDTVIGIFGLDKKGPKAGPEAAQAGLESGYSAMMGGNASLEKFWKPEQKGGPDGRPLPLNPRNSIQSTEWENYFSDNPKGNLGYAYNFYGVPSGGEKPDLANLGFKETVLRRWEETGTVAFKSDAARADFTRFVRQTAVGGAIGAEFTEALQGQGKEGLIDFKTPEAQAAFTDFARTLDARSLSPDKMAEKVLDFVKGRQDMAFKPPDPKFDDRVDDDVTKRAIARVAQHYAPAKSPEEFARRIEAFAATRGDIILKGEDPQAKAALAAQQGPQQNVPPVSSSAPPAPGSAVGGGAGAAPQGAGLRQTPAGEAAGAPGGGGKEVVGVYQRAVAEGVTYGAGMVDVTPANLAELGLSGEFSVYTMDGQGNLTEIGEMTPDKLLGTSFRELRVQPVMQDGMPIGYFAFDPGRDTGLYLGADAIDRETMSEDFKAKLRPDYQPEISQVQPVYSPSPANQSSFAPG